MLNRFLVLIALFSAAAATPAGEELMPMAPGSASGKNMVKITLPSLAARARPAELALSAVPGLTSPQTLINEPVAVSKTDSWRYHVPGEMRFPMESPLGAAPDAAIASNQGFDSLLDDLVDFDAPPPAPVAVNATESIMPLVPPAGAGAAAAYAPARVSIPSLPMPSEILRNDPARRTAAFHDPLPVVQPPALPPVAGPAPISADDFRSSSGLRPALVHPAMRARRTTSPDGRPVPEDFTPMRNLRHSISTTR